MDKRLFADVVSYQADSKKIVKVARIDFQKGFEYLVEIAKKCFLYIRIGFGMYGELETNRT